MIAVNFYNPTTMRNVGTGARRRQVFCASVILVCFALLAFGTSAKVIQNWPHVNAKLQISNSCKIEKQHDCASCDQPQLGQALIALIAVDDIRFCPTSEDKVYGLSAPFIRFISFRPPPSQA